MKGVEYVFILDNTFLIFFKERTTLMKKEKSFQSELIDNIEFLFPECLILKNDPTYIQGIPDLLILFNNKWAMLECKRSPTAICRPNQEYYIDRLNKMSYARVVSPETKEAILDDLQNLFES